MKPKFWKKKSQEEIKTIVFNALKDNVNYQEENILGIPASFLGEKVFYQDASFLEAAPFISTLIQNPNHIGCHTLGQSESFFKGTQKIEKAILLNKTGMSHPEALKPTFRPSGYTEIISGRSIMQAWTKSQSLPARMHITQCKRPAMY